MCSPLSGFDVNIGHSSVVFMVLVIHNALEVTEPYTNPTPPPRWGDRTIGDCSNPTIQTFEYSNDRKIDVAVPTLAHREVIYLKMTLSP